MFFKWSFDSVNDPFFAHQKNVVAQILNLFAADLAVAFKEAMRISDHRKMTAAEMIFAAEGFLPDSPAVHNSVKRIDLPLSWCEMVQLRYGMLGKEWEPVCFYQSQLRDYLLSLWKERDRGQIIVLDLATGSSLRDKSDQIWTIDPDFFIFKDDSIE